MLKPMMQLGLRMEGPSHLQKIRTFTLLTNGNTPVKLTSTSGRAFWLRWSPDGCRLRFTLLDPKTLGSSLWELQADRRLRQLLKEWKGAGQLCCGVWTADSKHFLFLNDLKEYWAIPDRPFPLSPLQPVLLSSVGLPIAAAATSPLEKVIFVA